MYVGGIPSLLHEDGAFLAFLAAVTAIDALSGPLHHKDATGQRFQNFVVRFFSAPLSNRSEDLWKFRDLIVHAFNPGPFALVVRQSRLHLTMQHELTVLVRDHQPGARLRLTLGVEPGGLPRSGNPALNSARHIQRFFQHSGGLNNE
jgi:hypothetical protein